jgi:hypothetical protein
VKAITLTQPWATLVALKEKRYETRSWDTAHRGQIAIHAAKNLSPVGGNDGLARLCWTQPFASALERHGLVGPPQLPIGDVVAVAVLAETFECGGTPPPGEPDQEAAFGDFTAGRFMWELHDVVLLDEPVAVRGRQRLWNLPPDVEKAVRGQL